MNDYVAAKELVDSTTRVDTTTSLGVCSFGQKDVFWFFDAVRQLQSMWHYLVGKVFLCLQNAPRATAAFRLSLSVDPTNYESLDAIATNHLLTREEERGLVTEVAQTARQMGLPADQISALYLTRLKKVFCWVNLLPNLWDSLRLA